MSKSIEQIHELLSDNNSFEIASKAMCATIEAIKEKYKYIDTSNVEKVLMTIYDEKSLQYPEIVRVSQALKKLPLLIEPLVHCAMREQIRTEGHFTIPNEGYNKYWDVFSEAIRDRFEICEQRIYRELEKPYFDLYLDPRGELKKTFARYNCDDIYFIVRIEIDVEDFEFFIDDEENVESYIQDVFYHVHEAPSADDIEGLVRHVENNPNPNVLLDILRYSEN